MTNKADDFAMTTAADVLATPEARRDRRLYGSSFAIFRDGKWERVDPRFVAFDKEPPPPPEPT